MILGPMTSEWVHSIENMKSNVNARTHKAVYFFYISGCNLSDERFFSVYIYIGKNIQRVNVWL